MDITILYIGANSFTRMWCRMTSIGSKLFGPSMTKSWRDQILNTDEDEVTVFHYIYAELDTLLDLSFFIDICCKGSRVGLDVA